MKHEPTVRYRAIEVASEPVTRDEDWTEVPNATVFETTDIYSLHFRPMGAHAVAAVTG